MNFDAWRPFIAKLLAPLVGLIATWLKVKIGVDFGVDEQNQVLGELVNLVVFAISTGITGVGINKIFNPGNAASSGLAVVEKDQADAIKSMKSGDNGSPVGTPSPAYRRNVAGSDTRQDSSGKL